MVPGGGSGSRDGFPLLPVATSLSYGEAAALGVLGGEPGTPAPSTDASPPYRLYRLPYMEPDEDASTLPTMRQASAPAAMPSSGGGGGGSISGGGIALRTAQSSRALSQSKQRGGMHGGGVQEGGGACRGADVRRATCAGAACAGLAALATESKVQRAESKEARANGGCVRARGRRADARGSAVGLPKHIQHRKESRGDEGREDAHGAARGGKCIWGCLGRETHMGLQGARDAHWAAARGGKRIWGCLGRENAHRAAWGVRNHM
eukprot:365243-Chlamydomonas_euryale.AAC.15